MRVRPYACVRGETPKDCGPAALATVVQHYGSRVSLLRLAALLETDLQGTSLAALCEGARRVGFEAASGLLPFEALESVALPLIALQHDTGRGHFVVVHAIDGRRVTIADPSRGIVRVPRGEFAQRWSRQVVLLRPGPGFVRRPRQRGPFVALLLLAATERGLLWTTVWLAALTAALTYAPSVFLRIALDTVVPTTDRHLLAVLGLGLCTALAARVVAAAVRNTVLAIVAERLSLSVGLDMIRRLLHLPAAFHDTRPSGVVFSRFIDAPRITNAITGSLLAVVLDVCLLSLSGLLMMWFSTWLGLLTVGMFPVVVVTALITVSMARDKERLIQESLSAFSARFLETIGKIRIVKAYAAEGFVFERLEREFLGLQRSLRQRTLLGVGTGAVGALLTGGATIALLWIGTQSALERRLSVGDLILYYSVLGIFLATSDRIGQSLAAVQQALVSIERVNDIRSVPLEDGGARLSLATDRRCHSIVFQGVSFGYRRSRQVLNGITFEASPGEPIALLGHTGSGKSTILALISGLYHPTKGELLLNGRDIRELDPSEIRRTVSIVQQDPGIIEGTIRDNIALGKPAATDDEIHAAAAESLADEFVRDLPRGYDYELGQDGAGLSCGQRQRIAIARALLRSPSVLLLDEATSNLDPDMERRILARLAATGRTRITIIATHRLYVAAEINRIVLLDQGAIVEAGDHDSLIARRGRYYSLWRSAHPDREHEPARQ